MDKKDIFNGDKMDPPVGHFLQKVFWDMVSEYGIPNNIWTKMMDAYVNDPRFKRTTRSSKTDRARRITAALTGTTGEAVSRDFMWKRFMEGLVVTQVREMRLTCVCVRGRFNTEKAAYATCNPELDHIRTLKKEDIDWDTTSNVKTLDEYFSDTKNTYTQVMDHILLKIMWEIMYLYKIDISMWNTLLTRYVHNKSNCPQMSSSRNDRRHNLQQRMRQTKTITWKRFLEVLKVCDVKQINCIFLFTNQRGFSVEVPLEIDLKTITFKNSDRE